MRIGDAIRMLLDIPYLDRDDLTVEELRRMRSHLNEREFQQQLIETAMCEVDRAIHERESRGELSKQQRIDND